MSRIIGYSDNANHSLKSRFKGYSDGTNHAVKERWVGGADGANHKVWNSADCHVHIEASNPTTLSNTHINPDGSGGFQIGGSIGTNYVRFTFYFDIPFYVSSSSYWADIALSAWVRDYSHGFNAKVISINDDTWYMGSTDLSSLSSHVQVSSSKPINTNVSKVVLECSCYNEISGQSWAVNWTAGNFKICNKTIQNIDVI